MVYGLKYYSEELLIKYLPGELIKLVRILTYSY